IAALEPLAMVAALVMPGLSLDAEHEALAVPEQPLEAVAACEVWMRAPEPQPVCAWVQPADALDHLALAGAAEPVLPQFPVHAELEPLSVPEEPFETPAACVLPMRSAEPEPVW